MFFSSKTCLLDTDFFSHFSDLHSHILYGVDDGVKEMSESLAILEYYESLGVKTVVFTPHINATSNDWDLINDHYSNLCSSYKGTIKLALAAEYMIDSGFADELMRGLRPIKGDMVLVESSYLSKSANFEESLYEVISAGYTPVIAHPERYLFMDYRKYAKLKDCDYLFQLNLLSLAGYYGQSVKERALKLLSDGMYDMIGADLHSFSVFKENITKLKLPKAQIEQLLDIARKPQ